MEHQEIKTKAIPLIGFHRHQCSENLNKKCIPLNDTGNIEDLDDESNDEVEIPSERT